MCWQYFTPENVGLAGRLVVGALLGALIGLERDLHGHSAGLRTHALVSLGATVFTVLSYFAAGALSWDGVPAATSYDPGRIAAQVVTGIGFLGAGTIIKSDFSVRGLTTASSLWLVAGIGMACGMGLYCLAVTTTALAFVFLAGVGQLERFLHREQLHALRISVKGREHLPTLRKFLDDYGVRIRGTSVAVDLTTGVAQLHFSILRREMAGASDGIEDMLVRLAALNLPLERGEWGPVVE